MMENNFYKFLQENSGINPEILDCLKAEIDSHLYYYGSHFINPRENKPKIKRNIRTIISPIYQSFRSLLPKKSTNGRNVVSNAYFNMNTELEKIGFVVYSLPWMNNGKRQLKISRVEKERISLVNGVLTKGTLYDLLDPVFTSDLKNLVDEFEVIFKDNKIEAGFFAADASLFLRVSILALKHLGKPTFVCTHGLPGSYTKEDSRVDYLIVWGEKIKEHYANIGFDPSRIFVSGHPMYQSLSSRNLRNDLKNVLVLTRPVNGNQLQDKNRFNDRSTSILYVHAVQRVLQKIGVESARLRPHPSENPLYYQGVVDPSFYTIDRRPITESLKESTIVIGPTSTVLLESIINGVNYVVFEPDINGDGTDLIGYKIVPPFNGSDSRVPVAKNDKMLFEILDKKLCVDPALVFDYIKMPFNIDFLKSIFKK